MTTTSASKRMRFAALGLTTALSVGVLVPFMGVDGASAATSCSTASAHYSTASSKLAVDQAKLNKAKKKLKKAKKHHKSHAVIKRAKKKVKNLKHKVAVDKSTRNYYSAQKTNCTTGGGSTVTPSGTANPLSDLIGQLETALAQAGVPAQVTDLLTQLQTALANLPVPAGTSSADFQQALSDAADQVAAEIQAALANPTGVTLQGLIDDIINPLETGLSEAGVPVLPSVLTSLQSALDDLLGQIPGLGTLLGGTGGLPITLPGLG